jgi:spore germination protein GerM
LFFKVISPDGKISFSKGKMKILKITTFSILGIISLALLFSACGKVGNTMANSSAANAANQSNTATVANSNQTQVNNTPPVSNTAPVGESEGGLAQSGTTEVKVYLVALGDNGKNGKKVGCDDSLVPVTRKVTATPAPLKAALLELFAARAPDKKEIDLNLGNYWRGMQLKSVSIENGTAIIHLTGEAPSVAGICDEPRIKGQIIETAKQFPTVKNVKVFINGKPMEEVISPV